MEAHPKVVHPDDHLHKVESMFKRATKGANDWAALKLAAAYGGAITIWLFAIYSTLGAIFTKEQVTLLYWSNAAQLVFCPLMVYVGNLLGRSQQAKADTDHQALTHIANTVDQILTGKGPAGA